MRVAAERGPLSKATRISSPPMWRLATAEFRKMVDTRAGIAMLAIIEFLVAGLVVVDLLTASGGSRGFTHLFTTSLIPVSLLLPVLAILSVTSEWSQRTALTTFALVPRRWRVLGAKMLAALALALLGVAACVATSAAGNALDAAISQAHASWHLSMQMLFGSLLAELIYIVMGIAFGLLLQSSPLAIVIYLAIPNAWSVAGNLVSWLRSWASWLDLNSTTGALFQDSTVSAQSWERLGISTLLWVVLPLGLGMVRLLREELK